jgi:hypothetical protein
MLMIPQLVTGSLHELLPRLGLADVLSLFLITFFPPNSPNHQ